MVYESELEDSRELIRISNLKHLVLSEGQTYILNVTYNENNDVYQLSQQEDSIFRVNMDGEVSGVFWTNKYPENVDDFIEMVFE
jgi:hypothetical protein